MEALIRIQKELKAPKDTTVSMGAYSYQCRSAEGIYTLIKPLLQKATLVLTDQVKEVGGRVYIGATATIKEGELSESSTSWAREQETQRGLNAAQVTAICSSMARKYALQGLFLLDDGKDADTVPPQDDGGPADWTPTTGPAAATKPTPRDGSSAPAEQPAAAPQTPPAAAPQGQIPAPTPEQRKWLGMLWDYYVGQSQGRIQAKDPKKTQKLCQLCQMHMHRYPGSMSDVDRLKDWITVEELCS